MAWKCTAEVLVAAFLCVSCKANNPLFASGDVLLDSSEGGTSDSDGDATDSNAGDDNVNDNDNGEGEGSGGGSDANPPALACMFDDAPGFGMTVLTTRPRCGRTVNWSCDLLPDDAAVNVTAACCDADESCDTFFPVQLAAVPYGIPTGALGTRVQLRAAFTTQAKGCDLLFAEMYKDGQTLPYLAGSKIPFPDLVSIAATPLPPIGDELCACEDAEPECCPPEMPPGRYSLAFSLPEFGDAFTLELAEGEEFDGPIGDFGNPVAHNFSSHRRGECGAPLIVDWAMTSY